jgi:uncharacterized protein (TIGR02996 family)
MDERRALMAAIIANPDDDMPRLAFADWLQEHGDKHDRARAAFIRLQVEAERLPECDRSREKMATQAERLRKRHAKHWVGPLARLKKEPLFHRGLLFHVDLTPAAFLKPTTQQALIEGLPLVGTNGLLLSGPSKKSDQIAASPVLGLVPALAWWYTQMNDAELKALAKSPHTGSLTALTLEKILATDAGLKALAKSPRFAGLRKLRLLAPVRGGPGITAKGIRALLASDQFPRLDTFALVCAANVKTSALCAEPALARLKRLYLCSQEEPAAPVCHCPYLTSLEELQIECCSDGVSDREALALLDNPAFAKLRRLVIVNSLNDEHWSPEVLARLRERFGDGFSNELDLEYV